MANEEDRIAPEPNLPRPGQITYNSYLRIGELTSLQNPLSNPVAHDEMLFIIIHQSYELWFKLVLFELDSLVRRLEADDLIGSFRSLDRVCEIFRALIQQIDILETMTPVDFNRFRSNLNPASGFQSTQFRELEILAGLDPAEYERFSAIEPEWKYKLEHRKKSPTVKSALISVLKRHQGLQSVESKDIIEAIGRVYSDSKETAVRTLCEYLIRFDEQVSLWRFRHVQMVERMIGMKMGTGGSLGVAYLRQTLKKRFFSELWEARTGMGSSY